MSKYSFEDDVTLTKAEIARFQLEDAIELFLAGKRISAVTLAGAAEEIFSRLLNLQGEASTAEETWEQIDPIVAKNTGICCNSGASVQRCEGMTELSFESCVAVH